MSDSCATALCHADGLPALAVATVASGGVRWRCCATCALLFNNGATRAVFHDLTSTVEPRPPDLPETARAAVVVTEEPERS